MPRLMSAATKALLLLATLMCGHISEVASKGALSDMQVGKGVCPDQLDTHAALLRRGGSSCTSSCLAIHACPLPCHSLQDKDGAVAVQHSREVAGGARKLQASKLTVFYSAGSTMGGALNDYYATDPFSKAQEVGGHPWLPFAI